MGRAVPPAARFDEVRLGGGQEASLTAASQA